MTRFDDKIWKLVRDHHFLACQACCPVEGLCDKGKLFQCALESLFAEHETRIKELESHLKMWRSEGPTP